MPPLRDVMTAWHDLFMLFGAASATLIGLLFVAASVGSNFYTEAKHNALRSFLSPSVVHFACVLAACLIAVCPLRSWMLFGLLIGGDGLFGFVYAVLVLRRMVHHGYTATIDLEDRVWYAALPAIAYVILTMAGATLFSQAEAGCDMLAAALGLLLLVGIRNAWDMTVFTVIRRPD
jgi:hypothetical protein